MSRCLAVFYPTYYAVTCCRMRFCLNIVAVSYPQHPHEDWIVAQKDWLVVSCDLRDGTIGNPQAELALVRTVGQINQESRCKY